MEHAEFRIGLEFYTHGGKWRCTDVGNRTIAAIRIDEVELSDGRRLSQAEAEAAGWFNGPPYSVAELVFDEDDFEECRISPDA